MPTGKMAVIEAENVSRTYGSAKALANVSLQVKQGELFGLVGADGSGKTTLIQILAAILNPSGGKCRVLGFDTVREATSITSRIGYMAQGFTLYETLTVAENLDFSAKLRNLSGAGYVERSRRLLEMAGLQNVLERPERQLSGGMRKKLALCTNLIHQPELLLLDEPSLGVDPLSRKELWTILREFQDLGTTIVFSTSYLEEAGACDRVAFLDEGRIIATGRPAELIKSTQGSVYEVATDRPHNVREFLDEEPEVTASYWSADKIRFQMTMNTSLDPSLRAKIEQLGSVLDALPTMEDVFVNLQQKEKPKERIRISKVATAQTVEDRIPANHEFAIKTENLGRRFGSFWAVSNVSLAVKRGEVVALLGPNGAGKTTLIRMLCGLLAPTEGTAQVAGLDATREAQKLRSQIGYLSQKFSLYPDLSVGENISFFASAYGLRRQRAREAIDGALTSTNLQSFVNEGVKNLSSATRQRVALACSLLHRPKILFLDEPTSGVDPLSRHTFWNLIRDLAESGTTVLVSTHYPDEANYGHRLGVMSDGRLLALEKLASLKERLGLSADITAEEVFTSLIMQDRLRDKVSRLVGAAI